MRIDVGVWSQKKLRIIDNKEKSKVFTKKEEETYESHWLRFEKYMGQKWYLGTSTRDAPFILTDIDYVMKGNTFFKWDQFSFRNV